MNAHMKKVLRAISNLGNLTMLAIALWLTYQRFAVYPDMTEARFALTFWEWWIPTLLAGLIAVVADAMSRKS